MFVIPFGGGTSVSNALKIPKSEKRMVVSVDTRRMNKIELGRTQPSSNSPVWNFRC